MVYTYVYCYATGRAAKLSTLHTGVDGRRYRSPRLDITKGASSSVLIWTLHQQHGRDIKQTMRMYEGLRISWWKNTSRWRLHALIFYTLLKLFTQCARFLMLRVTQMWRRAWYKKGARARILLFSLNELKIRKPHLNIFCASETI